MATNVIRIRSAAEVALELVQRDYPEYHPLISLARLAHRPEVIADPKIELEVHKTILPYVSPKLANVEVKHSSDDDRRVVVSLFEDVPLEDGRIAQAAGQVQFLVEDATEIVPLDSA